MMTYINSIQSEWIKTKRSASFWLSIVGGFFIPLLMMANLLYNHATIDDYGVGDIMWKRHFMNSWENMAIFLLPMGIIMSGSLITQMEYKNNTWKQLHTTPQSFTTIFASKFTVILIMMLTFFLYFNIGVYLSALIPSVIFKGTVPSGELPWLFFLKGNWHYFVACLPILAIQYLLSLQFKNFIVPVGTGLVLLIGTLIAVQWKYVYISPFSYCLLNVLSPHREIGGLSISGVAMLSFLFWISLAYILYIRKKEKG